MSRRSRSLAVFQRSSRMLSTTPSCHLTASILDHMLERIGDSAAVREPFAHVYLEEVFPVDVYRQLLRSLPAHEIYDRAADRHYGNGELIRSMYPLSQERLKRLSGEQQDLWRAVAAALTAPEVKEAMFKKLACDLAFRYGVPRS